MIYKKSIIISGSHCGANAELSIVGTFSVIQDSVTELMGSLKIDGITAQKKYGEMWVFSKNKIKIIKNTFWGDVVSVESYISNISIARFCVTTLIKDTANDVICYAKTEVCGIDLKTGQIRKVETIGIKKEWAENIDSEKAKIDFSKLKYIPHEKIASEIVKSTNIDFCHHTNNVEYIRILSNMYSVKK